MSFLGVKVILFLVIPLIIKEKSNASALRSIRDNLLLDFAQYYALYQTILCPIQDNIMPYIRQYYALYKTKKWLV